MREILLETSGLINTDDVPRTPLNKLEDVSFGSSAKNKLNAIFSDVRVPGYESTERTSFDTSCRDVSKNGCEAKCESRSVFNCGFGNPEEYNKKNCRARVNQYSNWLIAPACDDHSVIQNPKKNREIFPGQPSAKITVGSNCVTGDDFTDCAPVHSARDTRNEFVIPDQDKKGTRSNEYTDSNFDACSVVCTDQKSKPIYHKNMDNSVVLDLNGNSPAVTVWPNRNAMMTNRSINDEREDGITSPDLVLTPNTGLSSNNTETFSQEDSRLVSSVSHEINNSNSCFNGNPSLNTTFDKGGVDNRTYSVGCKLVPHTDSQIKTGRSIPSTWVIEREEERPHPSEITASSNSVFDDANTGIGNVKDRSNYKAVTKVGSQTNTNQSNYGRRVSFKGDKPSSPSVITAHMCAHHFSDFLSPERMAELQTFTLHRIQKNGLVSSADQCRASSTATSSENQANVQTAVCYFGESKNQAQPTGLDSQSMTALLDLDSQSIKAVSGLDNKSTKALLDLHSESKNDILDPDIESNKVFLSLDEDSQTTKVLLDHDSQSNKALLSHDQNNQSTKALLDLDRQSSKTFLSPDEDTQSTKALLYDTKTSPPLTCSTVTPIAIHGFTVPLHSETRGAPRCYMVVPLFRLKEKLTTRQLLQLAAMMGLGFICVAVILIWVFSPMIF